MTAVVETAAKHVLGNPVVQGQGAYGPVVIACSCGWRSQRGGYRRCWEEARRHFVEAVQRERAEASR